VSKLDHHVDFLSPDEVVAALELPEVGWERVRVGAVEREVTDPDGRPAAWVDNVIMLRRR
jgi:hypothetical protein